MARRGRSSATCSKRPAASSWPRGIRTIRSTGPRGSACSPGSCAASSRAASSTPGRPTPKLSAPATRRSRSSGRTRTTTTSAPRSTAATTTGSGGRGARRSGSASTSSPVAASAAAAQGSGATLHEEQMHIEPDGTFEVIISPARASRELVALRGGHEELGDPPDVPRQAQPGARRPADRAHRRRRLRTRSALTPRALPRAAHRGSLREGRRRHRCPMGRTPVPVAQRVL